MNFASIKIPHELTRSLVVVISTWKLLLGLGNNFGFEPVNSDVLIHQCNHCLLMAVGTEDLVRPRQQTSQKVNCSIVVTNKIESTICRIRCCKNGFGISKGVSCNDVQRRAPSILLLRMDSP